MDESIGETRIEHRETDNFLWSVDSFLASRESSDIGLES